MVTCLIAEILFSYLFSLYFGKPPAEQPVVIMLKQILIHYSYLNIGVLFLLIVFIGPYVEELVFRGFIFRIMFKYMNLFWAVFLSALLWASCHYLAPMIFIIFFKD